MNVTIYGLAVLILAVCTWWALLGIGMSGRPLNARSLHRPWVLNLSEEVRLAWALIRDALINPREAHADSGIALAVDYGPHLPVVDDPDDDEDVEPGGKESSDEPAPDPDLEPEPAPMNEPGSDVETKELPVLYYDLGPLPEFDPALLHSGMTGAFPVLDAILADVAA